MLLLVIAVAACAPPGAPADPPVPAPIETATRPALAAEDGPPTVTTTALDGNRLTSGLLDLDRAPVALEAGFVPTLVVAAPLDDGHLLVASDRAHVAAWVVPLDGDVVALGAEAVARLGTPPVDGRPALVRHGGTWTFAPSTGNGDGDWETTRGPVQRSGDAVHFGAARIEDVLPDARWAVADGILAVPVAPTDEYRHGVLGDAVEAAALAVADAATGDVVVHPAEPGTVLEGLGAVLADVDRDGRADPVVTLSDPDGGARLAVLVDGRFVTGPAIGTGNRWRHLVGVQEGRLVEVVTPHLSRVLQVLTLRETGLTVEFAAERTIASHAIGSRDLDRAALVDVTGDAVADVLGPSATEPATLEVRDGVDGERLRLVPLSAGQTSNTLGVARADGSALLVVGTADGRVQLLGLDR